MAVWFRHGSCVVGADDGLIKARDFARFTSLLNAARSVGRERDRLTAEGREEADAVLAEASAQAQSLRTQAEAFRAQAQAEHERAEREGHEAGYARGLEDWADAAAKAGWTKQQELNRQTARLADIVLAAVGHLIDEVDREALYRRALRNVVRILQDVPTMVLKVPEAELERARSAVDTVLSEVAGAPRVEVLADASLLDGACIFESDLGIVDASLPVQLSAIRRAVARAAQLVAAEAVLPAPAAAPTADEAVDGDPHEADADADGDGDGDGDAAAGRPAVRTAATA